MTDIDTLHIIGNGFDRYHGIPSAYTDFGAFLKSNDADTFDFVEEYFGVDDEFWSYFETRLADFDADALVESSEDFLTPYSAEGWKDSDNHTYEFEIEQVVTALSSGLRAHFTNWVRQLKIPDPTAVQSKLLHVDPKSTFLNFNYTSSLTKIYGVEQSRIVHLHGSGDRVDDVLILGHGWDPRDMAYRGHQNNENEDTRVIRGNQLIDKYFKGTFKPTAQVIADHQPVFRELGGVEQILVMGHSLADVDLPYFHEIIRHIRSSDVHWRISFHGDGNLHELRGQFQKLEAGSGHSADFVRLVDF